MSQLELTDTLQPNPLYRPGPPTGPQMAPKAAGVDMSSYHPGKAQPTQSPSQGTPYGQLPPTGSPATSYADAWNAAMPKGGDGVTFTPARSVIGAGAGNMAYAQPGQRPEGFSTQSYDLQGNPVTQGQQAQQRDAFVSQILQAPRDTPQHDFQGMLGKANDMVKDGWQNPFNFNQQQGQTAQPPSPGGQPSSPGVQGRPDNRMAIQDLFTQNNIQAPPGFLDQLIARLGGGTGGGGGERGSAQGYGGEQAPSRGPEQPQWSQKPVLFAPSRGPEQPQYGQPRGIWEGPPSSHGQPSQPIAPQQPPTGNDHLAWAKRNPTDPFAISVMKRAGLLPDAPPPKPAKTIYDNPVYGDYDADRDGKVSTTENAKYQEDAQRAAAAQVERDRPARAAGAASELKAWQARERDWENQFKIGDFKTEMDYNGARQLFTSYGHSAEQIREMAAQQIAANPRPARVYYHKTGRRPIY